MSSQTLSQIEARPRSFFTPTRGRLLQRACACGQHTAGEGECAACRQQRSPVLQRAAVNSGPTGSVPPIVQEVLRAPGQPLDAATPAFMEPRFGYDFSGVRVQAVDQTVQAPLPRSLAEDDLIHQPIIEHRRREHGLPPGGVDEAGQRVGPSDAAIKYGRPFSPGASLFYVSFQNVAPPAVPDHSEAYPGPGGAPASRAGYTSVKLRRQMTIDWGDSPPQADGRIPVFAQSVNVFYRLDPIYVAVSSNYAVGSCPYRVTLAHEQSHVEAFTRIFHAGRDPLVAALNGVAVPTQATPGLVPPAGVAAERNTVSERLRQVIQAHSTALKDEMERDRDAKDTPAAYARVHDQCPAGEW